MRKSMVVLLLGLTVAACGTEKSDEHADHTSTAPVTSAPKTSAASETPAPHGDTVTVTDADSGQERRLEAGQRLVLRLNSNPSTGFSWRVTGLDQNVVKQVGDMEYIADQPVMPGSPGTEVRTFTAAAVGVTQLQMVYRQPWETGGEPGNTFSLVLVVV